METELGEYSRENKDLKRQLEHMELKLRATNREIKRERKQVGILTNLHQFLNYFTLMLIIPIISTYQYLVCS